MQDISYKKSIFLAEEIGREVARQIAIPPYPEIPILPTPTPLPTPPAEIPAMLKTEEIRPRTAGIINFTLTNANQWYEIKLPVDAVTWQLKTRGNFELRYSFSPTHETYVTLAGNDVLSEDTAPNATTNAIYVSSPVAGVVIEAEHWVR